MAEDGAALPPPAAGAAPRDERHLSRRRTPFAVLAMVQVSAAALCLVFAIPGMTIHSAQMNYPAVAAVLLTAAAVTWWLLPRLPRNLGIDVALVLGYLVAAGATLQSPTDEGQVLIGLGLTLYAVSAAYFLPRRRMQLSLALLVTTFGAAALANPQMSSPGVFAMIVAVNVGLATLVSRLVRRLRALALHDGLTGLLNRHGLDLLAPPLLAACARSGLPVTVGLVDLDQFKTYNDTHGHLAGDRLLQHVADAWQHELRASDLAARFGGDEFAIVLVDTDQAAAAALESRVQGLRRAEPDGAGPGWTVGWAVVEPGEPLYAALDRADAELLGAKRSRGVGRP